MKVNNKIDRFIQDIKYFRNNGVGFRELLQIVCYKTDQENPANKWLKKLDSQVNKKGVLVLDIQDMFIFNSIVDTLGEEIARYLMGGNIHIPRKELDPSYLYSRNTFIDFDYIDEVNFLLCSDICILISEEILKEKY